MSKLLKNIFVLILGIFLIHAEVASAAVISFLPAGGTYGVGQTFAVEVIVSSPDQAVNAFSGDISFPEDKLAVQSVSKTGSIVNFWATDPAISSGSIHYEGITLDPGYTGYEGKIIKIIFKARSPGQALVQFTSASVLRNDGLGTSAISTTSTASYTIVSGKEQTVPSNLPEKPIVTSSTHPNQDSWYQNNTPRLEWSLPSDVLGVGLAIDHTPTETPVVHSLGRVTSYTAGKLTDGLWFAHVRYLNQNGWGDAADYRLGIDTTAPVGLSIVPQGSAQNDTAETLGLSARDATSGIDHYAIAIDGGDPQIVAPADSWQTPALPPQEHTVSGTVFDKAGNSATAKTAFTTTGVQPPTIDSYPNELESGDTLAVSGHAYPRSNVTLSILPNLDDAYLFGTPLPIRGNHITETQSVETDQNGSFNIAYDKKVKSGTYLLSAIAKLGTYESLPSPTISIAVHDSFLTQIIRFIMRFFNLLILLISLTAIYLSLRYYRLKKQVNEDLSQIGAVVQSKIEDLKKTRTNVKFKKDQIAFLENIGEGIKETREDTEGK